MMKKLIALVIAMALICCAASSPAETETPAAKTVHQIEQKMIDVYIGSIEACFDMPFYFMDGVTDLPWIDLESASGLISGLASSWYGDTGYSLDYTADGETIALIRENDFSITFDFAENSISCLDYNMFLHKLNFYSCN